MRSREPLRRIAHVAVDVARRDIDKTKPTSLPFSLATDGGPVLITNIGQRARSGTCAPVGVGTSTRLSASRSCAKIARITRVDRITLSAFDSGRDVFAADGRLDDVVYIANF